MTLGKDGLCSRSSLLQNCRLSSYSRLTVEPKNDCNDAGNMFMIKNDKDGWMNAAWLSKIIRTVTARGRRAVTAVCSVDWDDIRQDLLLDAYQNVVFGRRLRQLRQEDKARKLAYGFLNKAWLRRRRLYLATCPRLVQF